MIQTNVRSRSVNSIKDSIPSLSAKSVGDCFERRQDLVMMTIFPSAKSFTYRDVIKSCNVSLTRTASSCLALKEVFFEGSGNFLCSSMAVRLAILADSDLKKL